MSLIQTAALDLWGFKNTDIDSRILDYKDNFCEHFLRLFHQSKIWAEEKPTEIGLQNYNVFKNTYLQHKEITYNSKNIVFETCVSDIKDRFLFYLQRLREKGINPDLAEDPHQPQILSDILLTKKEGCFSSACHIDSIPLYKEEEYLQFFGPGEFPFMRFYVVRIGNQDYSFWNIVR